MRRSHWSIGRMMLLVAWIAVNVAVFRWIYEGGHLIRSILAGLVPLGNVLIVAMWRWLRHYVRIRRRERGEPARRCAWFLLLGSLMFGLSVLGVLLEVHEWYMERVGPPVEGMLKSLGWVRDEGSWDESWMAHGVVPVLLCVLMSGPGLAASAVLGWVAGSFLVVEPRGREVERGDERAAGSEDLEKDRVEREHAVGEMRQ